MSDKKLLEESTIRRFMQLANIKPVAGLIEEKKAHGGKHEAGESKAEEKAEHGKGHKSEKKEKKVEESLEEMHGMKEEGTSMPVSDHGMSVADEGHYEEEGLEEAGMEGGEGEGGGDVRAALEQIKAGVDMLLGMIEGGAGVELGVEEEPEAGEGEEEGGMEDEEEAYHEEEGLEEAAHEEAKMEEEGLEEKKGMPPALKAAMEKKKGKKPEEEKKMEEEALAEELTRRVAARLVAEMKKGGGKWGSGPKGQKPKAHGAPKSPKGYKPAKKA